MCVLGITRGATLPFLLVLCLQLQLIEFALCHDKLPWDSIATQTTKIQPNISQIAYIRLEAPTLTIHIAGVRGDIRIPRNKNPH